MRHSATCIKFSYAAQMWADFVKNAFPIVCREGSLLPTSPDALFPFASLLPNAFHIADFSIFRYVHDWFLQGAGTKEAAKDKEAPSSDTAASTAAAPPELHVLLSPELMSELMDAFIEFFGGVAVPPPDEQAGAATASAELPAPSPNLVFAALQVSCCAIFMSILYLLHC